jgi:hypothetical protein
LNIRKVGFFTVVLSALGSTGAQASFVSLSPDPMLGGNLVTQGSFATPFGDVTTAVTNISEISNSIVGGNDVISYTATSNLTFYTSPALTTVVTFASLPGLFEITIYGRTTPFETGTFNFVFDSSAASGLIGGEAVSVQLNPSMTSGGTTTITPGPGLGQYTIDTIATQYSQYSINGSAFVDTPALGVVGTASVPEPSPLLLSGIAAVVGLGAWARRRSV